MAIPITVKYEAGHSYREVWEKTEYFCPECGKRNVWHDTSGGDYYVGEEHLCVECESSFHLPIMAFQSKNKQDKQRLEAIRGAQDTPEARSPVE